MNSSKHNRRPILIVEDDLGIRDSLSDLLMAEGHAVLVAEHGQAALDILQNGPIPPAMILLDLSMPVMDGTAFLEEFKQRLPEMAEVPVLIMTAAGQHIRAGGHDPKMVLRKPLNVDQLMNMVEASY